ncbi:hypothetical protein [Phaeodactylibacter sp.]|uniref:hypothetical protein n=1 Tax=Phaeodactylibacter sp. TaxID=1940289 RepID=UPI0025E171AB|nr:hypothetical protein [Phaeodactylibacter sp.]MCI4650872.1 D52 family tumor protein [Phaeodactylibacter sp.]MCI5089829.1 D52 family tumor protein [Phaeodactylibacter sp.]
MKHESKAKAYVQEIGKKIEGLPTKFKENFEAMEEFEDIMYALQPNMPEYKEALAEWKDYDEQILAALQRDFPKKKPAPKAASKPAGTAKAPANEASDLFETTEKLPKAAREIVEQMFEDMEGGQMSYEDQRKYLERLESEGYTFEMDMGGMPTDLKKKPATDKKKPAPKKKAKPDTYSWKKAVPVAELQPVVLHCQHYHVTVKEPTEVSLKGTGNASRKVTAKPGEHIIFDDKGHPVFIMNAASFARKCTEQSTVEKHKEDKHKPASKPKASTTKPKSKPKPKPKTSKTAQASSKSDNKKPAAAKSASTSKPAAKKNEPAPKKKPESKPASSRRSPVAVIEQEINDIRNTQKKDMSATEREQLKKEYADLEEKASNKSYIGYIRNQLKAAEKDGVKLSEAQVRKLGQMIQPLIQNPSGAFIDMLYSNKKRLKPTYENLLRWTESPDRYDLIGVDTARTDETVTARKPEKPSIFTLLGI